MSSSFPHVTCLGCGCACDDIVVTVDDERIVRAEQACPLGVAWFGDGRVPGEIRVDGRPSGLEKALDAAADLLRAARGRLLVFLGEDLTCSAQQAAVGIADRLRAVTESVVSEHAAVGILAAQRRGRAGCTLGEIRNRADLVLFWGTDPDQQYPRFRSRFTPLSGLHLRRGHAGRSIVSVAIGADAGPAEADLHLTLPPQDEVAALAELRARLLGHSLGDPAPWSPELAGLVDRLRRAKYVALIHDGERSDQRRPPERIEALIALAQALNGPTRAALSSLRGGGNRSGTEAVLTWQTGFPFAVDFSRGVPRYQPDRRAADRLDTGALVAGLVVGALRSVPETLQQGLARIPTVVIGPRASEAPFAARVIIDTGVAGIHEPGVGYRMDDVPLPLQGVLPGPRSAAETLVQLAGRLAPARTEVRS
jgi:formylmethanofuran dehydrogenase subunit B